MSVFLMLYFVGIDFCIVLVLRRFAFPNVGEWYNKISKRYSIGFCLIKLNCLIAILINYEFDTLNGEVTVFHERLT